MDLSIYFKIQTYNDELSGNFIEKNRLRDLSKNPSKDHSAGYKRTSDTTGTR